MLKVELANAHGTLPETTPVRTRLRPVKYYKTESDSSVRGILKNGYLIDSGHRFIFAYLYTLGILSIAADKKFQRSNRHNRP